MQKNQSFALRQCNSLPNEFVKQIFCQGKWHFDDVSKITKNAKAHASYITINLWYIYISNNVSPLFYQGFLGLK